MANKRDITNVGSDTNGIQPADQLKSDGYILLVQDNDVYALPKSVWATEMSNSLSSELTTMEAWFDSVQNVITTEGANVDASVINDVALLKQTSATKTEMQEADTSLLSQITALSTSLTGLGTYDAGIGQGNSASLDDQIGNIAAITSSVTLTSGSSTGDYKGSVVQKIAPGDLASGIYIITFDIEFDNNNVNGTTDGSSTGYRQVRVSDIAGNADGGRGAISMPAFGGDGVQIVMTRVMAIDATKTYYLNAYQNSTYSIPVRCSYKAVRVANV